MSLARQGDFAADPGDPYVFRIDLSRFGIGTSRVVFSRSPHAGVTAFHLDLDVAPLSFDKQPATRDPRYLVTSALGTVAAATTANAVRRHRQYAPLPSGKLAQAMGTEPRRPPRNTCCRPRAITGCSAANSTGPF